MGASAEMIRKLEKVDPKVRDAFLCFIDEAEENSRLISVGRGDFNELRDVVQSLAEAQGRTEQRIEELAEIQKQGFHTLTNQIAGLGSRWGIYNEGTFRSTIRGLLSKMEGVEVREGYYGDRQVDVIIRNGEHVMLEITARMHLKDISKIYSSADDYKTKEGIEPSLMVATSYISPRLMEKVMGLERKIEVFSYEAEE